MKSTHIAALALFAGLWLIVGAIIDHNKPYCREAACKCIGGR